MKVIDKQFIEQTKKEELQSQLNSNQQIFLNDLRYEYIEGNPFQALWHALEDKYFTGGVVEWLSAIEQIEILQVFCKWALKREEENEIFNSQKIV
ncbi:hypothetical protein ACIJDA_002763 [Enterococcus faecalis]|nr:hypothetical protein [Staphylococcus epidermidis]MDU2110005.1 hypothetical protein [Peptoniphilus lacydonensis]